MNLNELNINEIGIVKNIKAQGSIRRRLLDIGIIKGTKIKCIGKSPSGNPKAFLIRGAVIAIRKEDCENILMENKIWG